MHSNKKEKYFHPNFYQEVLEMSFVSIEIPTAFGYIKK